MSLGCSHSLLGSPASVLEASRASGILWGEESLALSSCLLHRPVTFLLALDGVSTAVGKLSIKGARERLTAFFASAPFTLWEGSWAPPGGLDETARFPFLGLPRPKVLFCLAFFLPLTGLTCCGWGSGETLSTWFPTTHQSHGGFLLRLSECVSWSCSRLTRAEVEAGVEIFSVERRWLALWPALYPAKLQTVVNNASRTSMLWVGLES